MHKISVHLLLISRYTCSPDDYELDQHLLIPRHQNRCLKIIQRSRLPAGEGLSFQSAFISKLSLQLPSGSSQRTANLQATSEAAGRFPGTAWCRID
ncbi:hypothetical protein J1N35_029194 [Gossypium stocksii]|uniref:Uncharacterized protein n=1 Tax=Gossypium stocksii TaxID=47602 RepID=A0A9D3ZT46_9ROSI|nr:hypothetical protein J1N35_029194 [Gossypium stocksii]